jgi:hypothetical protein
MIDTCRKWTTDSCPCGKEEKLFSAFPDASILYPIGLLQEKTLTFFRDPKRPYP